MTVMPFLSQKYNVWCNVWSWSNVFQWWKPQMLVIWFGLIWYLQKSANLIWRVNTHIWTMYVTLSNIYGWKWFEDMAHVRNSPVVWPWTAPWDGAPLPSAFAKKPCEPASRADIHLPLDGLWDLGCAGDQWQHAVLLSLDSLEAVGRNLGKKWGQLSPFLQMEKGEPPIAWDANICKCQDMLGFKLPWPGASLFAQWSCGLVWCSARIC